MRQALVLAGVITGAFVLGAGAYLAKPMLDRTATARPTDSNSADAAPATGPQANAVAELGRCVEPAKSRAVQGTMNEKYRWAHTLIDQKLYDAALPELREIATTDPGFPGIHLDLSNALTQVKQPEQAKQAIDKQLAVSECLAKLPPEALDVYCKTELQAGHDTCQPQLDRIRQAAEMQATLIGADLGRRPQRQVVPPTTAKVEAPLRPVHVSTAPLVPRLERVPAEPRRLATVANPAPARKSSGDRTLMDGEGTDSALGAYSKPE